MRRWLMLVLVVALAALVFAPAAFAQDDNPTGDDAVTTSTATATPTSSATPTPSATPTATPTANDATPSATVTSSVSASPRADASALPVTGGLPLLSIAAGVLLVGAGIMAAKLMRRTS
jgi:carbohydrate-binding DOMON domain-containing protein